MNVTATPVNAAAIKQVSVNPTSIGSNVVVAAPTAPNFIRVLEVALVSTGANTVTFLSAASAISGAFDFAANGGFVLPGWEHGWFDCAPGEGLNVNLSGATKVAISIKYIIL